MDAEFQRDIENLRSALNSTEALLSKFDDNLTRQLFRGKAGSNPLMRAAMMEGIRLAQAKFSEARSAVSSLLIAIEVDAEISS
ncbi:MAG: hypothetical protein L0177_19820 [Chloroflexi bacterium]|nr:hypothetical protein [Chloroflexota bacterium]